MRMTFSKEQPVPEWGEQLCCPVCDSEWVHFNRPALESGEDAYKAWEGRGNALRVTLWCESGHFWEMRFGFHKGRTYLGMKEVHIRSPHIPEEHQQSTNFACRCTDPRL